MKDSVILKAENLSFSYEDGTKALKDVSLEIKKGEKVVFLGANGSGKSTFFLCLNGIRKPKAGGLYYKGQPYDYSRKGLLSLRKEIGIVFQEPDNQLFLSDVRQEIAFGLLNLGFSQKEAGQKTDEIIEEFGLTEVKEKPVHALSGGQKKQVSIADILVMEPEMVILDEPAAFLDSRHVEKMRQLVTEMEKRGITVLISTHNVDFAYEWAEKVIIFQDGKVKASGTPEEVMTEQRLMEEAGLQLPVLLCTFFHLRSRGIFSEDAPTPKNWQEFETRLEEICLKKQVI